MAFMAKFCDKCAKWDDDGSGCEIHTQTLFLEADEPGYPRAWIEDERGPRCTQYEDKKLRDFLHA